uniref:WD_REPEATS_REGION domain-containing protein n=1 Tax=Bursaphelenchus xylophilus TaxID=6326 RepID=A0A1I7S8R7_BURXY
MEVTKLFTGFHSENIVNNRAWYCHWKRDGKLLVTTGEDKTAKVWRFSQDGQKLRLITQLTGDHLRTVRSAQFSPCGRYIITASFDSSMRVYEQEDGEHFEEKHRLDGHEHEVKCASFSSSGQYMASASRDKNVFVWQVDEDEDFDVDSVLQNHTGDVKFVVWHPSENFLVSGGYDMTANIYRYDGSDWVVHQSLGTIHDETVWSLAFNHDGSYFTTVGGDGRIKVWKMIRGASEAQHKFVHLSSITPPDSIWPIFTVCWDPFRNLFACGGGDRRLWIYELSQDETITLIGQYEHGSDINCIAFNPKHPNVLSLCSDDGEIVLLELKQ